MKTRNFLIILGVISLALVFVFFIGKNTLYDFLGIETTESKLTRLAINNAQQKQIINDMKKNRIIEVTKNKVELNTTVENLTLKNQLDKNFSRLETKIEPEVNKSKIVKILKTKYKINLEHEEPVKKSNTINHNKTQIVKSHSEVKFKPKIIKNPGDHEICKNKITVDKTTYYIVGYRNIKAIQKAYEQIKQLPSLNQGARHE